MSAISGAAAPTAGLAAWIPQLARGLAAVALGVTITLTLDHSAPFGLWTFGAFAIVTGAILIVGSLRGPYAGRMRPSFVAQGIVSLLAGVAALVAPLPGVAALVIIVSTWAVVAGALELVSGIRARRAHPAARDWTLVGAITLLLGLVFLLVPPDLVQPFSGEKGVSGTLTSPIILVGVLGAWAIVVGVIQGISAVSLRTDAANRSSTP